MCCIVIDTLASLLAVLRDCVGEDRKLKICSELNI